MAGLMAPASGVLVNVQQPAFQRVGKLWLTAFPMGKYFHRGQFQSINVMSFNIVLRRNAHNEFLLARVS